MKYCSGSCRRNKIRDEGKNFFCPYHKSYTVDKKGGNGKVVEMCYKPSFHERIMTWVYKTFFSDLIGLQDLKANKREKAVGDERIL